MESKPFKVGIWTVDPIASALTSADSCRRVDPKLMHLLCYLARRESSVVPRAQLLEDVWSGQMVVDDVLNVAISSLRKLLDDSPQSPRYIKTVPRRGYALIATVAWDTAPATGESATPAGGKEPGDGMGAAVRNRTTATRLRYGFIGAVLLVAALAAALFLAPQKNAEQMAAEPRRLAVLPFDLYSADEHAYVAEGLTEAIINRLVQEPGLLVTSRTSIMGFRGGRLSIPEVAAQLDVDWILEGSIQVQQRRLQVTAQLIDVQKDVHVWSQTYQRSLDDLFVIQAEIASEIAGRFRFDGEGPQTATAVVPAAYETYLKARYLLEQGEVEQAETTLRQAIESQADFAQPHAELAIIEMSRALFGDLAQRSARMRNAQELAFRARDIDSTSARVRLALAMHYYYAAHDLEQTGIWLQQAYEVDNQDAMIHEIYIHFLITTKQFNKGLELADHMVKVNPLAYNKTSRYDLHYYSRDFAAAATELATKGDFLRNPAQRNIMLAWVKIAQNDAAGLVALAPSLLHRYQVNAEQDSVEFLETLRARGVSAALASVIDSMQGLGDYNRAELLSWAGRHQEAIDLLRTLVIDGDPQILKINVEPAFDALRGQTEFDRMIAELGLGQY